MIIKGGGVNYVFGGAVDLAKKRHKAWQKFDVSDIDADMDAFAYYVKKYEIENNLDDFYRRLYDAISAFYVVAIFNARPGSPTITISNDTFSSNYTKWTTKLKNIMFDGVTEIKGYCPYEPKVRLLQLFNYPIHLFTDAKLPQITIKKFTAPQIKIKDTTFEDIVPWLEKYEEYCTQLAEQLEHAIVMIDELRTQINNFN